MCHPMTTATSTKLRSRRRSRSKKPAAAMAAAGAWPFLLLLFVQVCSGLLGLEDEGRRRRQEEVVEDPHQSSQNVTVAAPLKAGEGQPRASAEKDAPYPPPPPQPPQATANPYHDVLVLICTQSFAGEELVEEVLLDRLLDQGGSNGEGNRRIKVALVDEAGIDWSTGGTGAAEEDDSEVVEGSMPAANTASTATSQLLLSRQARAVLVVASTYGDGDPPNHAAEFADWLSRRGEEKEEGAPAPEAAAAAAATFFYAVFGLGDSGYEKYCAFGEYVDHHLGHTKGGRRLLDGPFRAGDARADQSGSFRAWADEVAAALSEVLPQRSAAARDGEGASPLPPLSASTGADWRRSAIQPGCAKARLVGREELLARGEEEEEEEYAVSGSDDVAATAKSRRRRRRRSVIHASLALPSEAIGSAKRDLLLEPGDHVGVYPRNEHSTVNRALRWLGISGSMTTKIVERSSSSSSSWTVRELTASELLTQHVDLSGRATASTLRALLPFVGTLELRALARDLTFVETTAAGVIVPSSAVNNQSSSESHLSAFDEWVAGRRLSKLDLAVLFECRPSLQALARTIGPMQPRLYSVATVSTAPAGGGADGERAETTIGLCISIVEGGLCTNYLADLPLGSDVTVFTRKSKFHFSASPESSTVPTILIGAGSGIGPYIGFIEKEIEAKRRRSETSVDVDGSVSSAQEVHHLSNIRLFFGCRKPSEILYANRLSTFESLGSRVNYAFSRLFGQPKMHAQDLIRKEKATVWNEVFENRGRVLICGRLELCSDVKQALVDVAQAEGGLEADEALQIVQNMEKEGRLLTDCWSVDSPEPSPLKKRQGFVVQRLERHHASRLEGTTSTKTSDGEDEESHPADVDLSKVPAWPSYLRLAASGELERRVENATNMFSACVACGRFCEVDRLSSDPGDWGECRVGEKAIVSAVDAHFGEEDCLKGVNGSGTIFFGACNLKCMYCQNWQLSMMNRGEVVDEYRLASMMLSLQERGCHNINFVSPTHNVLVIMRAVLIAAKGGLKLPIVWNTGGYDSVASLRLLENVVDIYMPDAKYANRKVARKLSRIDNYPEINQAAIKEMHRQVGELQIDPRTGLAWRGVLVRHLVLPLDYAGTLDVASFLADEVSADTFTHVMDYYRPEYQAATDTKFGLARKPTRIELEAAHGDARCGCLRRLYGEEAADQHSTGICGCPCSGE